LKVSFNKLAILAPFSGFYLAGVTVASPIYIAFIICIFYFFVLVLYTRVIIIERQIFLGFLMSLLLLNQLFLTEINLAIGILITFFYPFIFFIYLQNSKREDLNKTLNCSLYLMGGLIVVDGIWRIFHPDLTMDASKLEENGILFQIFKTNSLMFIDSNFVGVLSVCLISLYLWSLLALKKEFSITILFILLFGLILTWSRAAFVGAFISIILFYLYKNYFFKIFISSIIIISSPILLSIVIDKFQNDISFSTKFLIIEKSYFYLQTASWWDLFFGVGSGKGETAIGMGTHNLFSTLIIELGLIGFLVYFLLMFLIVIKVKRFRLLLILPFLIISFSATSTSIPYFYTFLLLAMYLKDQSKDSNNNNAVSFK
jgi:hypothetical protein